MLSKLLTEWAPRPGFQSWNRATSSTVIMKTVFTDARFYSCCKNYLYLWTHMAQSQCVRLLWRAWAVCGTAATARATGSLQLRRL